MAHCANANAAYELLQQTYTPDGLLASLTDANGHATSFAYDGFDRLATTTYPLGSTEAFTYDADGNLVTGEREGTVKTIVQGRPMFPPTPVVQPRAFCCTRAMGAAGTRPSRLPH